MDFGLFTMFSTREGASQFHTFQEWFKLAQVAEDLGLDTLWLGESHFRPQRAVLASPLIAASAVAARTTRIRVGLAVQVCCRWPTLSAWRRKPPLSIISARVVCSSG